ncbi:hypothetical protein DXT99_06485 [Pontibacter diazotrophicus]|uniref:Uncharacterized protein n=1 Tax=Pontibacter diazotrophicus TaxID=1400979 RepID=A0A3D8LFD1_9BACT|nr:hypothetical protein DXT99_06485 [Pontibacter diazotrophicus]
MCLAGKRKPCASGAGSSIRYKQTIKYFTCQAANWQETNLLRNNRLMLRFHFFLYNTGNLFYTISARTTGAQALLVFNRFNQCFVCILQSDNFSL